MKENVKLYSVEKSTCGRNIIFCMARFVVIIIVSISLRFFECYAWLHGYDELSDIARLLFVLTMLVLLIVGIVFGDRVSKMNLNRGVLKLGLILSFLIMIVFYVVVLSGTRNYGVEVTILTNVLDKSMQDDNYYVETKNGDFCKIISIQCDKSQYDEISINENMQYLMTYRLIYEDADRGYLVDIDKGSIVK